MYINRIYTYIVIGIKGIILPNITYNICNIWDIYNIMIYKNYEIYCNMNFFFEYDKIIIVT